MTSWVAQEAVNSQARFQLSCIFQMWRGLLHKIKFELNMGKIRGNKDQEATSSNVSWSYCIRRFFCRHLRAAAKWRCLRLLQAFQSSVSVGGTNQHISPQPHLVSPHSWLQLLPERKAWVQPFCSVQSVFYRQIYLLWPWPIQGREALEMQFLARRGCGEIALKHSYQSFFPP